MKRPWFQNKRKLSQRSTHIYREFGQTDQLSTQMEQRYLTLYLTVIYLHRVAATVLRMMSLQVSAHGIQRQFVHHIGVVHGRKSNMKNFLEKLNGFARKITGRSSGRTKTRTIDSTHYCAADEFYIGVDSEKPVTVYLPTAPSDGKIIIIKAEMMPPLGSRKIVITTTDGSKIDGYADTSITVSHESKRLMYHKNAWKII